LAVEKNPMRYAGDHDLYSHEEIEPLIRDAASDQDATIRTAFRCRVPSHEASTLATRAREKIAPQRSVWRAATGRDGRSGHGPVLSLRAH
jgi:hypothetical protein